MGLLSKFRESRAASHRRKLEVAQKKIAAYEALMRPDQMDAVDTPRTLRQLKIEAFGIREELCALEEPILRLIEDGPGCYDGRAVRKVLGAVNGARVRTK